MEAWDFAPGDWREWRRFRALQLKEQGWSQRHIAAALGVSEDAVSRWLVRARSLADTGNETCPQPEDRSMAGKQLDPRRAVALLLVVLAAGAAARAQQPPAPGTPAQQRTDPQGHP